MPSPHNGRGEAAMFHTNQKGEFTMKRFSCAIGLLVCLLFGAGATHADNKGPSKKIAILIFDGVEIIDYSGPYEVFGTEGFEVYTVAENPKSVVTNMGSPSCPNSPSGTRSPLTSS
jgi:hypothetical protein